MKTHAALFSLALVALAPSARAQSADEHLARAMTFYNLQDWPHALAEYKEAYAISANADVLWSIAQVERLSGDCRGAIFTYKAYARGASARGANAAQELIAKCEATLVAEEKAAQAATASRASAPPVVVAPRTPSPLTQAKPKSPTPWIFDPLGNALGVVALGALATGTTLLTLGNVAMGEAARAGSYQAYDLEVAAARTQQQIGVAFAIGGAAFAGLALWRFAIVAARHAKSDAPTVALTPFPGGAGWAVRF